MTRKNRRLLIGILSVIVLLFLGWLAYQMVGLDEAIIERDGFRSWLWQERRFDLLLQMTLIFAGTLSIAAILPIQESEDG
ncbi:MAG: hypothetical protein V2J07_06190 [Anaerolineae bacterium]|jgi:hypothetical protein|nr:hypothetical protein [Anaerolineae bacterium]